MPMSTYHIGAVDGNFDYWYLFASTGSLLVLADYFVVAAAEVAAWLEEVVVVVVVVMVMVMVHEDSKQKITKMIDGVDEVPIGTETTKRMVTRIMMTSGCLIPDVVGDDLMMMMMLLLLLLLLLGLWLLLSLAISKGRWVWDAKEEQHHRSPDCFLHVHCRHRHRYHHNSCCDEPVYSQHCESGYYLH
jgi:preprotein translocase subunit SecG